MAEAGEGDDAVFEVEETYNPLRQGVADSAAEMQ
jgi:hypothetical protein